MKFLLFVQTGEARPKVAWTGASARRVAACYARDEARNAASSGPGDHVPPYWLVECHNADWGRTCIEASIASTQYGPGPSVHFDLWDRVAQRHGRILASGGRAA